MRLAWLVIAVFAARFLATAIAFPAGDGDLSWQRWLGAEILRTGTLPRALGSESFAARGAAWLPQEWAFSLAAASARDGAAWIVFAGSIACAAVLALVLAARRADLLGASPRAIVVCLASAGIALFASFGVRAQVIAWPFVALFVLALDAEAPWCYAALPLVAVWSNLHASALLAPVLAFVVAAGVLVERRHFDATVRRYALLCIGSLVAVCCNPFGIALPRYALSLVASPIKNYITEWQPSDLGVAAFTFGALPLLLAALVTFHAARTRMRDRLTFAAVTILLLGAVRNVPLFALVAAPLVARALTQAVPWFARRPVVSSKPQQRANLMLALYSGALAAVVGLALLHATERQHDAPLTRALAALQRAPGEHRVLCADFAWCGLVVGVAHTSVFLDGRADPYPLDVWHDFVAIVRLKPAWRERLAARNVNAVVVATDAPLDQALATWPRWQRAYRNPQYAVWVRLDERLAQRSAR